MTSPSLPAINGHYQASAKHHTRWTVTKVAIGKDLLLSKHHHHQEEWKELWRCWLFHLCTSELWSRLSYKNWRHPSSDLQIEVQQTAERVQDNNSALTTMAACNFCCSCLRYFLSLHRPCPSTCGLANKTAHQGTTAVVFSPRIFRAHSGHHPHVQAAPKLTQLTTRAQFTNQGFIPVSLLPSSSE